MYKGDSFIPKNFDPILIILILLTLVLFRLIFYFSGFMQEDAFIIFRSAFNFADYNIFSYNLDEQHTGVTSKIFGLLCYVFRLILKDYAILGIIAFNSFLGLIASYFIFKAFEELIVHEDISKKLCLLLIIGINPAILTTGITGLEYGLVVLFISLLFLYISKDKNNYLLLISSMFVPIARIELVAVNLIFIFTCLIYKNKKWLYLLFATFLGVLINFFLNYHFDDSIFSSSVTSKWMVLNKVNQFDLENLISSFSQWFLFSDSFFLSVHTKYINNFIYFITSVSIMILVISNFKYLIFYKFKQISEKEKTLLLCLSLNIIFVPAAYILSAGVMPWYLYPFSFLTYVLLGYTFIKSKYFNLRNLSFVLFLLFFLSSFQFLILKSTGFQENSYRSYVGQFIYNHSENKKKDTLFLEPSGYIPYFAKIKTYDTTGLSSPKIREYRKKGVYNWWFNFVKNEKPTYIVDRLDVNDDNFPHDADHILSKNELEWFKENYFKVKSFDYKNHIKNFGGAFKEFYNMGSHSSYHLFKLK